MPILYGQTDSGNCYKPRLLSAKLGRPFTHVEVSALDGTTRQEAFLRKNPIGKVPLLELDNGTFLAESNAILLFLGEGTRFVPADSYERGLVYQWLFFEQYSHEPYIAVRRALTIYPERAAEATAEKLAATLAGGNKALAVMEARLATARFLVGEAMTVADIALFAYTHEAGRAGFDMTRFPGIAAWLDRIQAEPDHVPLGWTGG